jgi:hypothetical protein
MELSLLHLSLAAHPLILDVVIGIVCGVAIGLGLSSIRASSR